MKKLKWILIILGTLVLCVGGYILYEFKFRTFDVADENVDQIVNADYSLLLPDGTELVITNDGKIIEEKNEKLQVEDNVFLIIEDNHIVSVTDKLGKEITHEKYKPNMKIEKVENNKISIDMNTGEKVTSPIITETNVSQTVEKITANSIKEKYNGTILALQEQAEARIENLIAVAKSEYQSKKANDESISVGYFYNKYVGSANSLESSTDRTFENLMMIIETDLVENGFNKTEAQSFRSEYEATKEELRSNLLDKALAVIK